MKFTSLASLFLFFFTVISASRANNPDWGATGHRTIGEIANKYLNHRTKRKIEFLLDGQSLAMVSTFGDEIKSDERYKKFYSWHYINMPFDKHYKASEKNVHGDLYTGIEACKEVILDKNSSKSDKAFYLKLLIHFIGDLHQPLHIGRKEDRGGNDIKVQWFYSDTNLHAVWDSKMIEHYNMTYTELADNADHLSKREIKKIQEGALLDWVHETQKLAEKIYSSAKDGGHLRYKYMYDNFHIVRSQLQTGGVRLAKVLNDLFRN